MDVMSENPSFSNLFGSFSKKEEDTINNTQNNSQSIMQHFQNIGLNILQVFSNPVGFVYWVFGLKWYIILCMLVMGTILFFQMESAIKHRKNARKLKKEGMMHNVNVDKMRGILRETNENLNKHSLHLFSFNPPRIGGFLSEKATSLYAFSMQKGVKKQVSFNEPLVENKHILFTQLDLHDFFSDAIKNVHVFFEKMYNLWMIPLIYVIFRNIGVR